MVEVSGKIDDVDEIEADIQRQNGFLIVELEGPGNDVEATLDAVPEIVGTSGTLDENGDIRTTRITVDVASVRAIEGFCQ
jgi:hypothetical protein